MAQLTNARSQLAQARLNLSYTVIKAPKPGVIGAHGARPGLWIAPGMALMVIVPLHAVYITANYRETQLTHVKPGQPVSIRVDAFPKIQLKGHVESLAPATGVTFSPIAPDNATGNFTKVVQRLPVKIAIDADRAALELLRVGMSVETQIQTDSADVKRNRGIAPRHLAS